MLTFTGTLKFKDATKQVTEKFKKRDFAICDNAPSYPQSVAFQTTQDRCSLLDDIEIGEEITVHFGLRGREWKNPQGEIKYFNSLDVFKIDRKNATSTGAAPSGAGQTGGQTTQTTQPDLVPTPDDDLPF